MKKDYINEILDNFQKNTPLFNNTENKMYTTEHVFDMEDGHPESVINKLNNILDRCVGPFWVLKQMQKYFSTTELKMFADFLEGHIPKHYVIEYNVRSRCGTKAYSPAFLEVKKDFSQDTFNDMVSYPKFTNIMPDGSIYTIEKNIDGFRGKTSNDVIYDRAWISSPKDPKDFLKYLEDML